MNPTQTAAWKALESHADEASRLHLRDLLQDPTRFDAQSVRLEDLLLFDYSKHRVTEETLGLLEQLFLETGAAEGFAAQLRGDKINATEGRAVLHTALRDPRSEPLWVDGQDARALAGGPRACSPSRTPCAQDGNADTPDFGLPTSSTSALADRTWAPGWPTKP